MTKGVGQILQDNTTGDAGETVLEHCTVMSDIPAHVDKDGELRVPALRFALDWVLVQPAAPDRLLHAHVLYERPHLQRILGEPCIRVQRGVVCGLEDRVVSVGDILIVFLPQEGGHFLEQRAAILEAGCQLTFKWSLAWYGKKQYAQMG